MQSGVLERVRQLHADIEQHRREIVQQLLVPAKHFRHELLRDHFIYAKSKQIAVKSDELLDLYDDDDYVQARDETVAVNAALRDFDAAVAHLREYHRTHPQPPFEPSVEELDLDAEYVAFNGNERHGRCLALQEHYSAYVTFLHTSQATDDTKGGLLRVVDMQLSYEEFVAKLKDVFHTTPCARKLTALGQYTAFVVGLLTYLEGFFGRVRPLHKADAAAMVKETEADFRAAWQDGHVAGWDEPSVKGNPAAMKAAMAEAFAERYMGLLPELLSNTVAFLQRKHTKTVEEIEKELEEEEALLRADFYAAVNKSKGRVEGVDDDDDEAKSDDEVDEAHFNKKNFPLDRNGKPIPVWLYHLHGLHIKHHCEICNYTYYGEKAYTQHFTELRHLKGLQRLGITEDADAYRLISTREKALEQWHRKQHEVGHKRERGGDEEIEDATGTVMTRAQFNAFHRRL